jgi:hypothetical protein
MSAHQEPQKTHNFKNINCFQRKKEMNKEHIYYIEKEKLP